MLYATKSLKTNQINKLIVLTSIKGFFRLKFLV